MNILSLQVKANTAEDIGRKLEKTQEKLEHDVLKLQGALDYLTKIESELNLFAGKVKEEVYGEDSSVELNTSIEIAKFVVERVMECSRIVHKHMERISVSIPVTEGKKEGVGIALKDLHAVYKDSKGRVASIEKDLVDGKLLVDSKGNIFSAGQDDEEEEENLTCHPSMFKKANGEEKKEEKVLGEDNGKKKKVLKKEGESLTIGKKESLEKLKKVAKKQTKPRKKTKTLKQTSIGKSKKAEERNATDA